MINGKTLVYELNQFFQKEIIEDNISQYTTVAGFLLEHLKAVPKSGDIVVDGHYTFEVMDIDGLRIDKVLMTHTEVKESTIDE